MSQYGRYSSFGSGGGGGGGTVTSVAFADGSSTPIFTITGSPITSAGTITETLNSQLASTVFAGPVSGPAAQPAFRALSSSDIPDLSAVYVTQTEVGAANGVASLDSGGKVPVAQLPASVMIYKGAWDASTNTPTLADGTGVNGWVYRASVAGTQDLGSGPQTWAVGDFAIYNGTIWQHSPAADGVSSVNGMTGAVIVNAINELTGDVVAGPATQSQSEVATIQPNVVSNSKLATMPAHTYKGNNTGSTGNALDLTSTQVTADLDLFTDLLQGLVPASGGGTTNFLRADGVFAAVVTDVTASSPLFSSGGPTPNITIQVANNTQDGYLSSTDWNTFNNKNSVQIDKFTLTPTDITNKFVTLTSSPQVANLTCLDVIGGPEQDYSTDFTVSGAILSWNGLFLDGVLTSGDKLIVVYY